jgi:energy-coupling factor transporter ATP-binding protein EcfA2
MKILQFSADNYKRIRLVEITPKGAVVQITGRNGQGKTSVLDSMWALFEGKRAIPDKPVRRGATKSRLEAILSDEDGKPFLIVKRTIAEDRTTTLTVEPAPGRVRPIGTPQAILDELIGSMSFDPLAFLQMEPAHQVQILRKLVKVDVDVDALNAANKADFEARTVVNREVIRLEKVIGSMVVQDGLPAEKIDEAAILKRIEEVDGINRKARELDAAKATAKRAVEDLLTQFRAKEKRIADLGQQIEELEKKLIQLKGEVKTEAANAVKVNAEHTKAAKAWEAMPDGQPADAGALSRELQQAQVTNREIAKRDQYDATAKELAEQKKQSQHYTRAIDSRELQKSEAMQRAAMPVDGLAFTEQGVWFNQVPLTQLGEGEQLKVIVSLAMASNPKLRAMPIHRGEALDDVSLAMIQTMAEENDFQIFMARVETSGEIGIVMEDGLVESDNQ